VICRREPSLGRPVPWQSVSVPSVRAVVASIAHCPLNGTLHDRPVPCSKDITAVDLIDTQTLRTTVSWQRATSRQLGIGNKQWACFYRIKGLTSACKMLLSGPSYWNSYSMGLF
jgi:hypothetical protein